MNSEKLAKLRALGFEFDNAFDQMAVKRDKFNLEWEESKRKVAEEKLKRDEEQQKQRVIFRAMGGQLEYLSKGDNKTAIYVINDGFAVSHKQEENILGASVALKYSVGKDSKVFKGLTGKDFRNNHPLKNVGTKADTPVYYEDLLDLTTEFDTIINKGLPEFYALRKLSNKGTYSDRKKAFQKLVTDNGKYDLKSVIINDGTPSYAAKVIGEWSLLNGTLRRYDDYGNISYGIFGKEADFSDDELYKGSDLNQTFKNLNPLSKTSGAGDEDRDKLMIKTGIYNFGKFYKHAL